MSTSPLNHPARGESLLSVDPELQQQVDPGWRRRMSLYTGRALTDTALKAEQSYRSGRLALLSQLVSPGIAVGLDATVGTDGRIHVLPGYGFAATGEDVTLLRELVVPSWNVLPVVDAVTANFKQSFADAQKDPEQQGGVFVLMLLPVAAPENLEARGCVEVTGEMSSSGPIDPEAYAFQDLELVDGAELALAAWPNVAPLTLPNTAPANTFRNRIATTVFDAELNPDPNDNTETTPYSLPWEAIGVAVGLAAFDASWNLLFFDRNSVVRSGGRADQPQLRTGAPAVPGTFLPVPRATVEARLLQVLEQNAQNAAQSDLSAFATLPPTAILPAGAVDLANKSNRWFPSGWTLHGAPIHAEEVETALRSQMFAAPFDLTANNDEADVLVPLTDDVYDPAVLVTEVLDPEFTAAQNDAIAARNTVLAHRQFLETEANALLKASGQPTVDPLAGLTADETAALGATAAYVPPTDGSESFGTTTDSPPQSKEVANILTTAASMAVDKTGKSIPLINADDQATLAAKGLPAFIDAMQAHVDKVDDLLNTSFLQTQTNIYRYRTNVLKSTDAARLVTSPIIANIAERESAVATAQDLKAYIDSITPPSATGGGTTTAATSTTVVNKFVPMKTLNFAVLGPVIGAVTPPASTDAPAATSTIKNLGGINLPGRALNLEVGTAPTFSASVAGTLAGSSLAATEAVAGLPSKDTVPTVADVTAQLPIAGVPPNLRTLNIAERLRTSPSHEALLYSIAARTSVLDTFLDANFAKDFGITLDDLEILVQEQDANKNFVPKTYLLADVRLNRKPLYDSIQAAGLPTDADEPAVFSGGITTLDHHTLLLRAVEARVALYKRLIALAKQALANVQGQTDGALAAITRVENDLSEARGNLSLVNGLINDELIRIAAVNARRQATLANVPFVVLMRPRTLAPEADVPSRQLLPADVASPVPAALSSTAIVPPELRELAGLLREAPPAWIPATEALLAKLERQQHFIDLAAQMRIRALARLQVPRAVSSATTHPGPYGVPIAEVFGTHQGVMQSFVQQRAAYDPAPLVNMSWASQKNEILRVAAINDLLASEAVHLEIAHEIAALVQNVSKIATDLYVRMSATAPIARLEWAEYLRTGGRSSNLRSLTILPKWEQQDYIHRQQMQMLVDWLFTQIDVTIPAAVAFMSDMVRTAILLASHAPVDDVIAGEVAARVKPAVGGLVTLTSTSTRVAHGMPVLLYKGANLMARAVVDDLDSTQVYAKVTNVYVDDFVGTDTQAHFLNDDPAGTLLVKSSLALR
jgi:hypothetical protein